MSQTPASYEVVIVNDVWVEKDDVRRGQAKIVHSEYQYNKVDFSGVPCLEQPIFIDF
ncbi:hypothetical protein [Psychrosphaera algicola]|uniref:Uncharacterized protein n=1 Tax=Psychrosphaera algicola TaxID=3023714 RepID=A0ABT5FAF7_9GAMM|nr:hypothetical protein [Psychrosphaera sp. G1-22]MDC2888520.1 hypothetical protein [Psychrosphaera sp. G1-22]